MTSLNYTPLRNYQHRSDNKYKIMLAVIGILIGVVSLLIFFEVKNMGNKGAVAEPQKVSADISPTLTPTPKPTLDDVVAEVLRDAKGEYGIAIKNLKTGEEYYHGQNQKYWSASLYKLWVMGAVYEAIENGKISEETYMKREATELNEKFKIATDDAEMKEGAVEMTVGTALEKMITVSDNYSALLLTDRVGTRAVRLFLEGHGIMESDVTKIFPTTTAGDIALYFEKLYKGELGSAESTEKMLALLKNQEINDILPKYLPEGTAIAHKTGQFPPYAHDAGIVYMQSGDYIIVLLAKHNDIEYSKDVMTRISEGVYNHFKMQ